MDETGESGFRPYAIIYMVVVTLFLYFISSYIAYRRDSKELKQCKIFYLEQPKSTGIAYCFSFTVNKRFCDDKEQDLVIRLGGAKNNGPLLHFRDFDNNLFQSGQVVNIGFYLPVDIGDLENIEIACVNNNNSNDDGNDLLSISHIAVRKFKKINCDDSAVLDFMPKHIRTWQQDFTGAKSKHCEKAILQAGQTKSFYLEEIQQFGQDSLVKFMWQHYLFSMSTKWHQVWSEYSCLDYMLVMCLDVLAITAIISTYYAYGQQACSFNINMNDVSSYERTTNWLDENWTCLVSISWMSLTCSLSIIPLSMIWWRLFQFIGGKGFTDNLLKSYLEKCNDDYENNKTDFLILRTLESKSVYEDTCMTTKRLLREEPVITNCSTDEISLHNLAYVRTKMGQTVLQGDEPDRKIVKRSNYVSAGGKPNIMSGSKFGMDGTVSTNSSQYSERLVQQKNATIYDCSVVAECFDFKKDSEVNDGYGGSFNDCKCCLKKCRKEAEMSPKTYLNNRTIGDVEQIVSKPTYLETFLTKTPESNIQMNNETKISLTDPWPDYDSVSIPIMVPKPGIKRKIQVKILSFFFLLAVQFGEIITVTALENEANLFFHPTEMQREAGIQNRTNGALLSCVLAYIFYLAITLQVLALITTLLKLVAEKRNK